MERNTNDEIKVVNRSNATKETAQLTDEKLAQRLKKKGVERHDPILRKRLVTHSICLFLLLLLGSRAATSSSGNALTVEVEDFLFCSKSK